MILHTPISMEEIFLNDEFKEKKLVHHDGKACYVEESLDGNLQVVQLLSSNPNDYLENKFYPGQMLKSE